MAQKPNTVLSIHFSLQLLSALLLLVDSLNQDSLPVPNKIPFWVIGNEAGFLTTPQERKTILMGPAERYDIIFDFTGKKQCNVTGMQPVRKQIH